MENILNPESLVGLSERANIGFPAPAYNRDALHASVSTFTQPAEIQGIQFRNTNKPA